MKLITFDEIITPLVDSERYRNLGLFLRENDFIKIAQGSNIKHQAWEGGLMDHYCQVASLMNRSISDAEKFGLKMDFSKADQYAAIVAHDFEKIFKYSTSEAQKEYDSLKGDSEDETVFVQKYFNKLHVYPTDEVWNAVQNAHGELKHYDPHFSVAHQLAAHLHGADWLSARIYKHHDSRFQLKK